MNQMDFCDTMCCYETKCYSLGTVPINLVGYHKVCDIHYQSMHSLKTLICAYCESTCKVSSHLHQNTYHCPYCSFKLNYSQNTYLRHCGHNHCEHCANSCFTQNQEIYYPQIQTPLCPNCDGRAAEYQLQCKHQVCLDCFNTNVCKECTKIVASKQNFIFCNKDLENPQSMYYRSCEHVHCDSCAGICKSNQNLNKSPSRLIPLCPNCNGRFMEKTLKCKHQGCLDCYDKVCCKVCEKSPPLCPNCKRNGISVDLDCSHKGCIYCVNNSKCENCKSIKSNPYFNLIKKCDNCFQYGTPCKFKCGHNGCSSCYFNSECFDCLIDKECINCKEKNLSKDWKQCPHLICIRCFDKNLKCKQCFSKCIICGWLRKKADFYEDDSICKICVVQPILQECHYCRKLVETVYKQRCHHYLCFSCYRAGFCFMCQQISYWSGKNL